MTAIPSESREEIEKLERKHADHPEGRYFVPLANAYRKAGELDRAMVLLREGLERHPDYLSAHIVLGRCLADRGESATADAEFRYVLSLDPQNLIALRTLGELAIASGKLDEARSWYGDLLSVDPMNEDARRALETLRRVPASGEPDADLDFEQAVPDESRGGPLSELAQSEPAVEAPSVSQDSGAFYGTMVDLDSDEEGEAPYQEDTVPVVTETIAELYIRQGFFDRAADVYRELIRRRGGDSGLEERLRRVEALAAAESDSSRTAVGEPAASPSTPEPPEWSGELARDRSSESEPVSASAADTEWLSSLSEPESAVVQASKSEVEPESEPEVKSESSNEFAAALGDGLDDSGAAADPFADSFLGGFVALDEPSAADAPSGRSPAVIQPSDDSETAGGGSIRDFLQSVVSWVPESENPPTAATAIADEAPRLDSPWAADGAWSAEATTAADETPRFADEPAPRVGTQEGEAAEYGSPAQESAASEMSESAAEKAPPETADLFPWEIPETDDALPSADVPTIEALELDHGYPFDDTERESGREESEGPIPELSVPVPDAPAEDPTSAAEAEPSPPTPEPQDDDDLESFQAWLRSLKR